MLDRREFLKGVVATVACISIGVKPGSIAAADLRRMARLAHAKPLPSYVYAEWLSSQVRAMAQSMSMPYEILSNRFSKVRFKRSYRGPRIQQLRK